MPSAVLRHREKLLYVRCNYRILHRKTSSLSRQRWLRILDIVKSGKKPAPQENHRFLAVIHGSNPCALAPSGFSAEECDYLTTTTLASLEKLVASEARGCGFEPRRMHLSRLK
jgi:hypothetical protein